MELQRIELLEDRSQYPRVRVKRHSADDWQERICLYINENNDAVCLQDSTEMEFLEGGKTYTACWGYWEEIKEPTYREGDDISHLLGAKVRHKQIKEVCCIVTGIDTRKNRSMLYCNGVWHPPIDFYSTYEHLDGTPIGVKEKI